MTDNLDLDAIEARAKNQTNREWNGWQFTCDVLALISEVRKLREALANPDDGKIWLAIKNGLTMGHTSMRKIVEAQRFEEAATHEDDLARKLEARVSQALKETA